MANQNIASIDKTGSIILKNSLVTISLLFLLITPAYGKYGKVGPTCLPEIWASDCNIHVNSVKTSMYINVSCSDSEKASSVTFQISSTGFPQKNGTLPNIDQEQTKSNFNYGVFVFENLKMNTKYHYVLKVRDKNSCGTFASGSLGTGKRNFTLSLKQIYVYDDGDDGISGNGELEIYVRARESSKIVPWEVIRFGSQNESWAESGEKYVVGKSLMLSNLINPAVDIWLKAIENDKSGFKFDPEGPEQPPDTSHSQYTLDLSQWEKNNKDWDDWSNKLLGSPSVKLMFKGWLEYEKGDHLGHDSYSHIQSIKPTEAAQPESFDKVKQYIPPTPEIKEPLEKKHYINSVNFDIRVYESPDWVTTTALEVQFFYGGELETVIIGYDDPIPGDDIIGSVIPLSGDKFLGSMPAANFTKKGTWELRVRKLVKSGSSDNWIAGNYSDVRMFSVETFDPESSKKFSLQPIIIKSPKGKPKWTLGSNKQIRWLATGVNGRMKITLLKKNGTVAGVIAENIIPPPPQPSGQTKEMVYNWRVGDNIKRTITPPSFFKIRIEEKGKYSAESDLFEITQTGALRRPSTATRTASPAMNQRQQVPPGASAAATPEVKKQQVLKPSKSLRIISPRSNQSFNFRTDVIVKTDHDSRFPVKYELKKGSAGRFTEVKPRGGILKGLGAGNYSLRISYQGMAPVKVVNFVVKKQESRTQSKPQSQKRTQQQAQPQTQADSVQPATRGTTRSQ